MKNDFIRKSAVLDILRARAEISVGTPKVVFDAAAFMIDKLPEANVDFVRNGKWFKNGEHMIINLNNAKEQYENLGYLHRIEEALQCSECRKLTFVDDTIGYNFCPHCGAKMTYGGEE